MAQETRVGIGGKIYIKWIFSIFTTPATEYKWVNIEAGQAIVHEKCLNQLVGEEPFHLT